MARGRHRAPTNTKRNLQRAALITVGTAAPIGFASAAFADEVVVVEGDTLSEIAIEKLGLSDWEGLYEENRAVIGDNPDLILPGQSLHFVGGLPLAEPPMPVEVDPSAVADEPSAEALEKAAEAQMSRELAQAIIVNSAGPVSPRAQAAANLVWADVPGASLLTIGGTRSSARDPHGHPSGNALDYMVGGDTALGDAIVQYHLDHWDELGVEYLIWQQRIRYSAGGGWEWMEDRGSVTQNHYDHPHVNYR